MYTFSDIVEFFTCYCTNDFVKIKADCFCQAGVRDRRNFFIYMYMYYVQSYSSSYSSWIFIYLQACILFLKHCLRFAFPKNLLFSD